LRSKNRIQQKVSGHEQASKTHSMWNEDIQLMDICSQDIGLLFETSWEVCNKVGGIYTVLSSKAKTLKDRFGDNLIFIGPDVWSAGNPSPYFIESRTLLKSWVSRAMLPEGVDVRVGRWDIPGKPLAILVKFDGMYADKDMAYGRMWDLFKVDSLHAYGDYDEGCAFARAAALVIESIIRYSKKDPASVIAHFDEWTTAMGLLTIKADMPQVATVFTTHATSIGRSICGNGKPLYDQLANYNGDQMAQQLNMESKHSLEKAAAWNADCFTTVSDVTAAEAAQLLGRKPDMVTPNGFEPKLVPAKTKYAKCRREARKCILEVAEALTGCHFDDDTFIVGTSGRLEYRNKGLDVFIDALARLQETQCAGRRMLALVMVPGWTAGLRPDLAHALTMGEHRRLDDPYITHRLNNYNDDPVNRRIHEAGFANDGNSCMSVLYVPCYLDGCDGIFNKDYYSLLPAFDGTVFASYYEPWGYTPLESIAFGVPTVTTTLAGFGAWVEATWPGAGFERCGVEVVGRTDHNYHECVGAIAGEIGKLATMSTQATAQARKEAMDAARKADWTIFIEQYMQAFRIAFVNRDARCME
jgi:glycosyltransferase involved in cell wall biosynthesis